MTEVSDYSKAKQIRSLLYVFGGGFLAALILTLGMLHYYNPSGGYTAENVLLTPENAFGLSFTETGGKSKERYVFDHLDFSYYDERTKHRKTIEISKENYAQFYALVKREISLLDVDPLILKGFDHGSQATLSLVVNHSNGSGLYSSKNVFFEVEFAETGDHYRVRLRQQRGIGEDWVYFYHPGVYQEVMRLFT